MWTEIALHRRRRRTEACQAFAVATGITVLVMVVRRTLRLRLDIMLHTDQPVCMMVMGNDWHGQHDDADEE